MADGGATLLCTVRSDCDLGFRQRHKYHKITDVNLSCLQIKRMVALDGITLAKNIGVSEDDFVQEKVFDRDPDKEDYQGYMGNWGPEATHVYHDSVQHQSNNLSDQMTKS